MLFAYELFLVYVLIYCYSWMMDQDLLVAYHCGVILAVTSLAWWPGVRKWLAHVKRYILLYATSNPNCDPNVKLVMCFMQLLKGEVYHYHTKLMMKEARTGGKHLWHQDYGYIV
jgi:hypothetical protein